MWKALGVKTDFEEVRAAFRRYMVDELKNNPSSLILGADIAVQFMASYCPNLAVFSGHPHQFLDGEIQRYGLEDHISHVKGGVSNKTDVIEDLLEELGINGTPREQILFVGDMEQDIEAGKAAGIHTCAIAETGYHNRERLLRLSPNFMIGSLKDIYSILAENLEDFMRAPPNLMINGTFDLTSFQY